MYNLCALAVLVVVECVERRAVPQASEGRLLGTHVLIYSRTAVHVGELFRRTTRSWYRSTRFGAENSIVSRLEQCARASVDAANSEPARKYSTIVQC
eukprot:COSAG01_NODE_3764_length_5719_cov_9.441815_4_plen_97_part_00